MSPLKSIRVGKIISCVCGNGEGFMEWMAIRKNITIFSHFGESENKLLPVSRDSGINPNKIYDFEFIIQINANQTYFISYRALPSLGNRLLLLIGGLSC